MAVDPGIVAFLWARVCPTTSRVSPLLPPPKVKDYCLLMPMDIILV